VFTGKKTSSGNTYTHRGKAKYLGGVGIKVTGKSKRKFRPNIQTVSTVLPDGSVGRAKVSTKAIKMGMVVKPLRRKYAYRPAAPEAAGAPAAE
jgi:large subunit ribosomal protein L28